MVGKCKQRRVGNGAPHCFCHLVSMSGSSAPILRTPFFYLAIRMYFSYYIVTLNNTKKTAGTPYTVGFARNHTRGCMGTVFTGTGTVSKKPTCGMPMKNPSHSKTQQMLMLMHESDTLHLSPLQKTHNQPTLFELWDSLHCSDRILCRHHHLHLSVQSFHGLHTILFCTGGICHSTHEIPHVFCFHWFKFLLAHHNFLYWWGGSGVYKIEFDTP